MMLLAVGYHYIRESANYPHPAIYPVQPEQLEAQLCELGRHFSFVSGDAILEAAHSGKPLPPRACLITFDDGLRCQYENALPVLDRLNVPALFFVCGRPLERRRALHVHRVHFVRANVAPGDIVAELRAKAEKTGVSRAAFDRQQETARRTYRYDEPEAALVKWYLNFGLAREEAERFVEALFGQLVSDEAAWCEATYMDRSQVRSLAERRYLGHHTFDHLPLATLDEAEMHRQVTSNQRLLREISGDLEIPFVSYPYGGANAVGRREADFCREAGLKLGFTVERAINTTLEEPLLLARVDTNDAPGGKNPLIAFEGDEMRLKAEITASRNRYFAEVGEDYA